MLPSPTTFAAPTRRHTLAETSPAAQSAATYFTRSRPIDTGTPPRRAPTPPPWKTPEQQYLGAKTPSGVSSSVPGISPSVSPGTSPGLSPLVPTFSPTPSRLPGSKPEAAPQDALSFLLEEGFLAPE